MTSLLVQGGPVYTPLEVIEDGAVFARDGVIERVGPQAELAAHADVEVDAGGRTICPGFVDLQVNGGGGALLIDEPSVETVERIARAHVRFGTTSMLPTAVTASEERMIEALAAVRDAIGRPPPGARILGSHLEGPFISTSRRGAHDERFVRAPDRALFERVVRAAGGTLRLITLAPELPGADGLIAAARAAGAVVSIGHSDATYNEAWRAIEAGAALGTHIFNGMRPFDRREPGVAGALLTNDAVAVSVIADGVHVHPASLRLVYRAKGAGRTVLVTDALSPVGAGGMEHTLYGQRIVVRDGACWGEDGTLSGSAIGMSEAVRKMRDATGAPLIECVRMATATPARVLGLDGVGVLRPGARADIVVCDADANVWKTFVGAGLAYDADGAT